MGGIDSIGFLSRGLMKATNLADIGRSFLGMGQSTMRDGACQRSAQSGRSVGSLIASTALLLALSDKLFLLEIAGSSPLLCLVGAAAPRPSEHPRGTGKHMEWYELKGHPTDAALPPLQAASEEAALGTFAGELNLKLDFAEEGETGEYVLTNTSTWKEWWVVISG